MAAIRVRLWLQCRLENGPAASEPCPQKRMTASWSAPRTGSTEYKRGSRDQSRPMAGSPRIIARQITRSRPVCRRARVGQGQAFGGAEEAPSLTPRCARRRRQYAVGTEECPRRGSNKRMEDEKRTTNDSTDEVILARKGAKSRRRITGLRSKTTKARAHIDRVREPRVELRNSRRARAS